VNQHKKSHKYNVEQKNTDIRLYSYVTMYINWKIILSRDFSFSSWLAQGSCTYLWSTVWNLDTYIQCAIVKSWKAAFPSPEQLPFLWKTLTCEKDRNLSFYKRSVFKALNMDSKCLWSKGKFWYLKKWLIFG
jgi:hypothetical protein